MSIEEIKTDWQKYQVEHDGTKYSFPQWMRLKAIEDQTKLDMELLAKEHERILFEAMGIDMQSKPTISLASKNEASSQLPTAKTMTKEITLTYKVEVEIDNNNQLVKDYQSQNSLLLECAQNIFANDLPVIENGGLVVKSIEFVEFV